MNARTLAAVAIRIAALIALAAVLASAPIPAFYAAMAATPGTPAPVVAVAQRQAVVSYIVRFAVVAVLFLAGNRIARSITREPFEPWAAGDANGDRIGPESLTALAFALVAVFFVVEGVETAATPLYLLATQPRGLFGTPSMPDLWQREGEAVARSVLTIVAAGTILWRRRIARSLAEVRRPPADDRG